MQLPDWLPWVLMAVVLGLAWARKSWAGMAVAAIFVFAAVMQIAAMLGL